MAITNGYCTLSEVKSALRLSDSIDDTLIEKAIEGASRRIDGYCGRFFYKTNALAVPLFANNAYRLLTCDISSTTGLIVKLDDNGDGTYETTLTLNTDYIVEPTDYQILGRPIRTLTMIGGYTYPMFYIPSAAGVQVTALWGWKPCQTMCEKHACCSASDSLLATMLRSVSWRSLTWRSQCVQWTPMCETCCNRTSC